MKLFSLLIVAALVLAQTTVETPTIGNMLDGAGQLRPVYGVPGGFVLGAPVDELAQSAPPRTERRGNAVFVLSPEGAVLDSLPSSDGPVLLIARGAVFTGEGHLILQRRDASTVRFPLDGVTALRVMSEDWVQAITAFGSYALRVESGREAMFALPATVRAEVRRR